MKNCIFVPFQEATLLEEYEVVRTAIFLAFSKKQNIIKCIFYVYSLTGIHLLKQKKYRLRPFTLAVPAAMVLGITLAMVSGGTVSAQITSPQADAAKELTYPVNDATDPLYVFYQKHETYRPGALTAGLAVAGPFDFIWTKYNPDADGFNIPVQSDLGVETSTISDLDEGGFRVQISNGTDIDTSFLAWVMLDNLVVWTEKDEDGKLESFRSGCSDGNYVIIAGGVEVDTFYYYDPVSHAEVRFQNDFDIEWTSDNPDLTIYNRTNKDAMGANFSNEPPYKDTWYILTATDSLGMTEVDSVLYDTKHTKAEFSVEYEDKIIANDESSDESPWSSDLGTEWSKDKGSLDAPLKVRFTNESLNGFAYTWVFLDTTNEISGLSTKEFEETDDKDYQPEFTYFTADEFYYPYLVSISDAGCVDTFSLEDGIEVVGSQLNVPNVFSQNPVALTPNDDGNNDYFKLKHQSIRECKITIVDRWGAVVYKKDIDDMYSWEGWNGKILNSNRKAPEGQYYYVVEAVGYDDVEYRDPNILEQRKINREQGGGTTQPGNGNNDETPSQNLYTGWIYLFRYTGDY